MDTEKELLDPNSNGISKSDTPDFIETLKETLTLTIPIFMNMVCYFLQQTIVFLFIGYKYPLESKVLLGSIGITNVYMNSVAFAPGIGFVQGIDTLCSNTYGAKNFYLMGVYMQRARLISALYMVFISIINFFFGENIIGFFINDPEILKNASSYIKLSTIYVFLQVFGSGNIRYINIMKKAYISLRIAIVAFFLHIFWCYFYIVVLDLGVVGGGLALITTQLSTVTASHLFTHYYNPCPESYFWINRDSFEGWKEYLIFVTPQFILTCLFFWAIEIQAFIAYLASMTDFNAHMIGSNLFYLLTSISIGFSIGTNIIIGKMIVSHSVEANQIVMKRITVLSLIFLTIICIFYYNFKLPLFKAFIDENTGKEVIDKGIVLMDILIVCAYIDVIDNIYHGVFKSFRKQNIAAIVSFIGYYVVQIIVSVLFALYLGYGVYGCWIGIGAGNFFCGAVYLVIYYKFDLKEIKKEIIESIEEDNGKLKNKKI